MSEINRRFGAIVRAARTGRTSRLKSQAELATAIGVSRTAITNIESGKQGITLEMFFKIAKALDENPRDLLPPDTSDEIESLVTKQSDADLIKRLRG